MITYPDTRSGHAPLPASARPARITAPRKRSLLSLALISAAVIASVFISPAGFAQSYPSRAVRVIVPSPPGDGSDLTARALAQRLSESWGQPVVVENRPGAGGRIGTEAAVSAPADGYTLLMGNAGSNGINAAIYKLPYDLERGFEAVTLVMRAPNVLVVSPQLGVNTVADLVRLLKAQPGKFSYGSGGIGSSAHLSAELFKLMAGVDLLHVPYKGAVGALNAVMSGEVALFLGNLPPAMGHIRNGRVRALGVTTLTRSPMLPEAPTLDEAGLKGFETVAWFGLFAPAGTSADIIRRVQQSVAQTLNHADVRKVIDTLGGEPVGNSPAEFGALVRSDIAKWRKVVAAADIRAE